ncbi:MAG: methylmalonyl Co-A mutase-associated GTPase MeaB [Candidatus Eisenbacteria sp.]|nr:methylmalonyl Co-A mutase-associated GTPase MeaB [Candidatus Eisenbacteria bacterium]
MTAADPARERARQEARALADRLAHGERRAIAQAISHVEDGTRVGRHFLDLVYERTGRARRVGITGPPGAGKSTLVHVLACLLRREGMRVGVLAVDPTSPFSGGAILGDRVRMPSATGDDGLFVRSMAARGNLGGVAATTYEASEVLEAAGFDWILIETVGVGQSELEVVELADTTVLLLVPESGDAVQVMKAGIMEAADIFVVNKFDREGGDRLITHIETALQLADWNREGGWRPPVCPVIATREEGVDEVRQEIGRHLAWLSGDRERLQRVRRDKIERRVRVLLRRALVEGAWAMAHIEERLQAEIGRIAAREVSPYRWVEKILRGWRYRTG